MTVPEQALEAAAKALYAYEFGRGTCEFPAWEHETIREGLRNRFHERARAALEAALPLMGVHATDAIRVADEYVKEIPKNHAGNIDYQAGKLAAAGELACRLRALPAQSGSGVREDVARAQEIVRQYRDAWRENIDRFDAEASHRENWDGSDSYVAGFDEVMNFVLALPKPAGQPVEGWRHDLEFIRGILISLPPNKRLEINAGPALDKLAEMLSLAPASPHQVHERETQVVKPTGQERS